MKYTTILFDLDGTLTRSEKGITRSVAYAAEKMGLSGVRPEDVMAFIGPPLQYSFHAFLGLSEEDALQATKYYRERFSVIGWQENEVYEGIPALLRSLRKNGAKIAIATAKPQQFAERIAEKFGMAPYLDAIIGPGFDTNHASKQEVIARAAAQLGGVPVMVGDRHYDIDGGQKNDMDTIGVTYGYGSEAELAQAGATHIAHSVAELGDILLGDASRAEGVFISMEGVDGCGKTTQREALVDHLRERGWPVQLTREPGGDEIAEKIRSIILDAANTAMCDETEAYLYAASRAQNVRALVLPALRAGKAVVCDRFVDSSIAYQGGGRMLGGETVAQLNAYAVGGRLPDITVYLRMTPQAALSRRLAASEPDRLEREKNSFFERTYAEYERIVREDTAGRFVTVNAAQPIEAVTAQMLASVDEKLDALGGNL